MLRFDINFVFTIINVLILFAVVKIFLIGRVHKILDARKAIVDEQFSEAEKKLEEADKTKQQYEDSIKDIEEEKERRFTEARNQANRLRKNPTRFLQLHVKRQRKKGRSDSDAPTRRLPIWLPRLPRESLLPIRVKRWTNSSMTDSLSR